MRFRLFRVDVEIQMPFWVTAIFLGLPSVASSDAPRSAVAIWVAVVLVSVLVHEYGHALAMKRYGIEPSITLHAMGGLTYPRSQPRAPLSRLQHVLISLAGPFAGFALGGLTVAMVRAWPRAFAGGSPLAGVLVEDMLWVNFGWGLINLLPVLPFDGGHVLEHALGPKRVQLTAAISTLVAFAVAVLFVYARMYFGAVLFGLSALQSYRRYATDPAAEAAARPPAPPVLTPEIAALLRSARHALGEEDLDRAQSLAERVIEGEGGTLPVPPSARDQALEVIAWTELLRGNVDAAAGILGAIRRARSATVDGGYTPDAALEGAVLFARGDLPAARRVLEAARAKGDDRKGVVGPLVQILLGQGEVGRAAEVALAVVDTLSDDDIRRMAKLASDHGSFAVAARLYEAIFVRLHQPEDAYEAARAEAQGGRPDRALDLLRRAVEAGFSDRARVWSDAALATLRAIPALEAVLPRP